MSQEADAGGSREAQARPAEAREEETCPFCLGPPEEPSRVFPCGHSCCTSCVEHWAAADRAECPLCRQLVGTLVSIPPAPPANASSRRPRRRLQGSQEQRERSPHRSRSVSPRRAQRSPSGRPLRLVRGLSWQRELNGRRRDAEDADWLREAQELQWGSGDHARDRARDRAGPSCC